jgi:hypothetical protein
MIWTCISILIGLAIGACFLYDARRFERKMDLLLFDLLAEEKA